MLRASGRSACPFVLAALLVAGCSGGGGGDGPPKTTCTKWAPGAETGPGDAARHFPLAAGDRWVTRSRWEWRSHEVTGTRAILGHEAAVTTHSDLDTRASLGETYRAVDDHGALDLGDDDPSDWLTDLVVPYYYARFPVVAGDAFTSVECTGVDYGEDLDGDGKNETLDLRIVTGVLAIEPIETPIATFPQAARMEQRITVTLRASGSPQQATQEGRSTGWIVPGVGPVREVAELPIGSPDPPVELVGWQVGDEAKGLLARLQVATDLRGPYATAFDGARHLVAGTFEGYTGAGYVARVTAVPVTSGGDVGEPLDLLAISGPSPIELSPPALAAGGGTVALLASTWFSGGEVLLQRATAAGTLLEPPGGRAIAPASSAWGGRCGPALASDGTGFLGAWAAPDGGVRLARIGADGTVEVNPARLDPPAFEGWVPYLCPVVAFDGVRYLVVYEWTGDFPTGSAWELRAVHVGADGIVQEATPLRLSATPGSKHPIAMIFDGTQHLLLLADGRDGVSTALTLRRLDPEASWLDGDAATGGLVLDAAWAAALGGSLTLDGTTTLVAWATGEDRLFGELGERSWVMRLGPDGAPLDLHGGLPGVDTYLGDPIACVSYDWAPSGLAYPIAVGGADGRPLVVYRVECRFPEPTRVVRGVRFGL